MNRELLPYVEVGGIFIYRVSAHGEHLSVLRLALKYKPLRYAWSLMEMKTTTGTRASIFLADVG